MEHTKKMLLVDPAVVQKLHDTIASGNYNTVKDADAHDARDNTPVTPLSQCDKEMGRILSLKNISDSDKWLMYHQTLTRFNHYQDAARQPIKMELVTPPDDALIVNSVDMDRFLGDLITVLPQSARERGITLFNRIKALDTIRWDELGVVTVDGKIIRGSSITDLMADLLRNRASSNPVGWNLFSESLVKQNIPHELIVNVRRKRFMSTLRGRRGRGITGLDRDHPIPTTRAKRRAVDSEGDVWNDVWQG
jgi:hypothetical protein